MTKKTTMFVAGIAVAAFAVGFYVFDNTSGDTASAVSTSTESTADTTAKDEVNTVNTENVNTENTPAAVPAVTEKNVVDTLDATE